MNTLTLALSKPDTMLLIGVTLLTLLAIGHLAVRWRAHTQGPAPTKSKGPKKRPPAAAPAVHPPSPPSASHPAAERDLTTLPARREWVRERVVHWWVVANRVHNAAIDDAPTVTFSPRLKHALGWADSSRNLIKISDHHLMDKSPTVADETVAHEVAHIFADRHYGKPCRHVRLWKKTMIAMGQKPDVTYKDTPQDGPEEDSPATEAPHAAAVSVPGRRRPARVG